jgi:hypothetical protein
MKTKIKDLKHAIELYNQGILVPMESILIDKENRERIFLGFISNFQFIVTECAFLTDTVIWNACEIINKEFHIKPKIKIIKLDFWVNAYANNKLSNTYLNKVNADDFAGKDRIACEHFTREIEVECEDA